MDIKQFVTGMVTDVAARKQPKDSYRFALNSVLEGREGKLGSILSEESNFSEVSVTSGHTVIGHVLTNTSEIVLFTTDNTTSEIGVFNPKLKTYSVYVSSTCLGFSTDHPVNALFRVRKGCERVIYFTDQVNTYKSISLDSLSQYNDSDGNFSCGKAAFAPDITLPLMDVTAVNDTGGQLEVGAYQFSIRYLDSDLNPTNWFYTTNPIWIYDENTAAEFDTIDGGIPIIDTPDGVVGGVTTTGKSIDIDISNIDTNFRYIQIAALHSTATTGIVSTIYVQPEIFADATTYSYTYRGPDPTGTVLTDLSDIEVDLPIVEVVNTHAQLDNRLWIAGTSSEKHEYEAFQEKANNIAVTWVTKPIDLLDPTVVGNSKNPLTPYSTMSMMGNEVYALGIRYLHANGQWSPAFHIPGREAIPEDRTPYTADANTEHLGSDTTYETWQVKNTAKSDGTMGYFESDVSYPSITDCNGDRIYPVGKIRHHQMPSRDIVQVNDATYAYPIGLSFSTPEYPSDDIVGHKFVVSIRNEGNSTVVDAGITIPLKWEGTAAFEAEDKLSKFEYLAYNPNGDLNPYGEHTTVLLTPEVLSGTAIPSYDYLQFNYALNRHYSVEATQRYPSGTFDLNDAHIRLHQIGHQTTGTLLGTDQYNRKINATLFVKPRSTQDPISGLNSRLENPSYMNTFCFTAWSEDNRLIGNTANKSKYVTLKRSISPYSDLESIQYRSLHHNPKTLTDSQIVYGGDVIISELKVPDTHVIQTNETIHGNVLGRTFVESTINFGLTYGGDFSDDPCATKWEGYYLDWIDGYIGSNTFEFFAEQYFNKNGNNYSLKDSTEYCSTGLRYLYNNDFSKVNVEQSTFGLSNAFNYCSNCINSYPYRLMYSEKAFQEETADNYRKFLANNYNDFLGKEGEISQLFIDKDQLYALTDRALWFVPTRPQSLSSNEATIYVGTGEVLSIPPKRQATADHSYGGSTQQLSVISTEFGTVYVDTIGRKIFLLSDTLKEISQEGINSFLEDNIELTFPNQYQRLTGDMYTHLHPTHSKGVGFICAYDPRYKRLIIHKKDYELIESKFSTSRVPDRITYDSDLGMFLNGNTVVQVGDPEFFVDKSWTISYSFKHQGWASYHSYLPNYMFNDEDTFFSTTTTNSIWQHNKPYDTLNFYGQAYSHIIDFISNQAPVTTQIFKSIFLHSDVEEYFAPIGSTRLVQDETFDKVVLYNTDQISGIQDIVVKKDSTPFLSVNTSPENVVAEKSEGVWKFSNLRDYNNSHGGAPIFSSKWDDIKDQYYIDKIPNPVITEVTGKTLYDTSRLRDEWVGVRLYYTPLYSTYRISTDLTGIQLKPSFR